MNPDIKERLTEQSIIAYRDHVIEECARVADREIEEHGEYRASVPAVARAIRGMKGEKHD